MKKLIVCIVITGVTHLIGMDNQDNLKRIRCFDDLQALEYAAQQQMLTKLQLMHQNQVIEQVNEWDEYYEECGVYSGDPKGVLGRQLHAMYSCKRKK